MHAVLRAREFVFDGGARRGRRKGVGHFEHGGDAAQNRRAAAAFQILLVLVAGLAEMDLAVDHAGQNMKPPGFENLGGLRAQRSDGRDPPTAHADIGLGDARRRRHHAATDQQIEGVAHVTRIKHRQRLTQRPPSPTSFGK